MMTAFSLNEIPPDVRARAHVIAATAQRDWRAVARYLLGFPTRALTQAAVERAIKQLEQGT